MTRSKEVNIEQKKCATQLKLLKREKGGTTHRDFKRRYTPYMALPSQVSLLDADDHRGPCGDTSVFCELASPGEFCVLLTHNDKVFFGILWFLKNC